MTTQTRSCDPAGHDRPGVRLTRRGRLVIVFTVLVLTLAAFAFGRVSSSAAEDPGAATATYEYVVVEAGDTLWSIAAAHSDGDPRAYVRRLVDLNGLSGVDLQLGQRLALPR